MHTWYMSESSRKIYQFSLSSSACLSLNSSLSLCLSPPLCPLWGLHSLGILHWCVHVCVPLCECVYEFCSTGMMHLVYPISLKTVSLLFSFSLSLYLAVQHNRTRHNSAQLQLFETCLLPEYISTCIVFLWSCVAQWIEPELKTLQSGCAVRAFLFRL